MPKPIYRDHTENDKEEVRAALREFLSIYQRFCHTECQVGPSIERILEDYLFCSSRIIFDLSVGGSESLSFKLYISAQYVRRLLQMVRNTHSEDWHETQQQKIRGQLDAYFRDVLQHPQYLQYFEE